LSPHREPHVVLTMGVCPNLPFTILCVVFLKPKKNTVKKNVLILTIGIIVDTRTKILFSRADAEHNHHDVLSSVLFFFYHDSCRL
jgi:hypothetical protein